MASRTATPAAVVARQTLVDERLVAPLVLLLSVVVAQVGLLLADRGAGFYVDDWDFILQRPDWSVQTLLDPHNEHLVVVPLLLYRLVLALAGLSHYWAFGVLLAVVNGACVMLVYAIARRSLRPTGAALLAAPLVLLGAAWSDLLSPFEITVMIPMATGLGAMLLLGRASRVTDAVAALLLLVGVASSGLGLAWLAAIAVYIVMQRQRRRLWVVAPASIAYAARYVYAVPQTLEQHGPGDIAEFVIGAFASSTAGYAGLPSGWGPPLALAVVIGALLALRRLTAMPAAAAAPLAGAVVYWALSGYSRPTGSFTESRYLLPGAIFLAAAAGPLLHWWRPRRQALVVWAGAALFAIGAGLALLQPGLDLLTKRAAPLYGRLAALELALPDVKPAFQPDPIANGEITAGRFAAALRRYRGSPAMPPSDVRDAPNDVRLAFDQTLVAAEQLALTAPTVARGPTPRLVSGKATVNPDGCYVLEAGQTAIIVGPGLQFTPPGGSTAHIALSRLGAPADASPHVFAPGAATSELRPRRDALDVPWIVTIAPVPGTLVCGVAG